MGDEGAKLLTESLKTNTLVKVLNLHSTENIRNKKREEMKEINNETMNRCQNRR